MAVRIITDSTCDIEEQDKQALAIDVLPLKVIFGDREYIDGVNLSAEQFYSMLGGARELPKTSQVVPHAFSQLCARYLRQGDEIVILTLSSELSGTWQSAQVACSQLQSDRIFLVDSRHVTMGLMALVLYAVTLRDSGLPACEIAWRLEKAKDSVKMYAIIDSLKYLRMGGRISSTAAVAGGVLGIKPVITVENGTVQLVSKARGFVPAAEKILEYMKKDGINTDMPVVFGHSNSPEMAQKLAEIFCPAFSIQDYRVDPIGPVVGTHAGPGCAGIAFFSEI